MKAITYNSYGSTDNLQFQEVCTPIPKDNEILIRIIATTVTPVDLVFRKGENMMARLYTGLFKPKKQILGTELAGEIEAIGKNVQNFKPGDRVFAATPDGFGAHASYICMPNNDAISLMPTNMSFEEAATICNGALTALPFLRNVANIKAGQKVLINGASGSIGIYAIQLAKHFGAHVTGVCSTANLNMVTTLGADRIIDYTSEDFTTGSERYDIIFDTVSKSTFSKSKKVLSKKGVYLATDLSFGILFQMLWTSIMRGKRAKFSATGLRTAPERIKDLALIKSLIEAGKVRTIIDRSYPMDQIGAAYDYVEKGHKKGNVVVSVAYPKAKMSAAA